MKRTSPRFTARRWPAAAAPLMLALIPLLAGGSPGTARAQAAEPAGLGEVIGKIKPRHAREIASSSWSVGGETLDRDFTVYANYKAHLGPLGAKAIRLQAGWAKCEKTPGVYQWAWLDEVIDDALAQGVQPWVQLSYGNPIYPGGGDTGLGGGLPRSPEALAAWERWVRAVLGRYGNRVSEWEVWNEPDLNEHGMATVEAYTDLYIRTASAVREVQPKGRSRIYALALCYDLKYAEKFITAMQGREKLDLIDAVTIHTYPHNPDDTRNIDYLRRIIAKTGRDIPVRQGETGAPSKFQKNFALKNLEWSDTTQAKWDLRRMLAHHAKDVPFSLFAMIDMHYRHGGGKPDMNYKGLLESAPDQTVARVKPAYYAAQRVFAIFDDTVRRVPELKPAVSATRPVAVSGYRKGADGPMLLALWFNGEPPVEWGDKTPADVVVPGGAFTDPVYVDLMDGVVRAIPRERWSAEGGTVTFRLVPIYDAPVLIADRSLLPIEPVTARAGR